jgi:hypothetical protein
MDAEEFLPLRHGTGPTPAVTEVRSTLIVSAIQTFRARGLHAQYLETLGPDLRERIVSLIAGQWIPVDLAIEHYRAADGLGFDSATIDAIGADVADRVSKSSLSIMVKMSKSVGVTPWTALANAHRLNDINWRGGDVRVWKLGPKDARFDWHGQPCAQVPYFVISFGGFLRALTSLFCTKAYTRVQSDRCSPTSISYRLSWA